MQSNREGTNRSTPVAQGAPLQDNSDHAGYGLPCANCRKYYAADLAACPTCHSTQRIGASTTANSPAKVPQHAQANEVSATNRPAGPANLPLTTHAATAAAIARESSCLYQRKSARAHAPAAICKPCHEEMKDRMNTMEAALHMDLKEATQIIYEAVWAETSDPNKSYQNAAQALLTELRKRAGVTVVLGPIQLLPH
jgi:hypothetical protein